MDIMEPVHYIGIASGFALLRLVLSNSSNLNIQKYFMHQTPVVILFLAGCSKLHTQKPSDQTCQLHASKTIKFNSL